MTAVDSLHGKSTVGCSWQPEMVQVEAYMRRRGVHHRCRAHVVSKPSSVRECVRGPDCRALHQVTVLWGAGRRLPLQQ